MSLNFIIYVSAAFTKENNSSLIEDLFKIFIIFSKIAIFSLIFNFIEFFI